MKLVDTIKAITTLVPIISSVVRSAGKLKVQGRDKFEVAVAHVAAILDESFDDLPEWRDLPEAKRDTIVEGLVELVLFLRKVVKSRDWKRALKKLRSA